MICPLRGLADTDHHGRAHATSLNLRRSGIIWATRTFEEPPSLRDTSNKIPQLSFDAATLPTDQQFAAWAKFAPMYDVSTPSPELGFLSDSSAWQFGDLLIHRSVLGPVTMRRTAERIRADNIDHYCALLMLAGRWQGDLDGRTIDMGTGDICLMDLSRPSDCTAFGTDAISLLIPRVVLDDAVAPFDLHGLVLNTGPGALLSDYLTSLVRRLPDLDTTDAAPVAQATRDLFAGVLRAVRLKLSQPASSAVLARAKRYIALNLATDLSLATLCAALGTTRSTLSRAFAPLGGVAALVQARRLAKVHAVLSRPDEHRTIAEIAHAAGFTGIASFYRVFHKAYGYTAGALRAQNALPQPAAKPLGDANEAYLSWDERLR